MHPESEAEHAELEAFLTHAQGCKSCARIVAVLRRLDRLIATLVRGPRDIVGPCPEPEALVTWMAGERSVARRLELHLVACPECRDDVVAAALATNWKARVAAVSTRRLRLESTRLAARTSRRVRLESGEEPAAEPEDPRRKPPRGGVGLLVGALALAGVLCAAAVARASPSTPWGREASVSMPAPESTHNAPRVAQADHAAEDSDRP